MFTCEFSKMFRTDYFFKRLYTAVSGVIGLQHQKPIVPIFSVKPEIKTINSSNY